MKKKKTVNTHLVPVVSNKTADLLVSPHQTTQGIYVQGDICDHSLTFKITFWFRFPCGFSNSTENMIFCALIKLQL